MKIKVIGPGCSNCKRLEDNVRNACNELNLNVEIEKVSEINKIIECGIMSTPALIVDDKILFSGKVPSVEEIKKMLVK